MVFFLAVFEGSVNQVNIDAFRLVHIIELPIPAPAIKRCGLEDQFTPAVKNVHFKGAKPARKQLLREEIIIEAVIIRGESIGDGHVTIIANFYGR